LENGIIILTAYVYSLLKVFIHAQNESQNWSHVNFSKTKITPIVVCSAFTSSIQVLGVNYEEAL